MSWPLSTLPPTSPLHALHDALSICGAPPHVGNKYQWKNVMYVRCLPHCLNLVMKAFLGAFDATFDFSSNLKALPAFILAGGSPMRRNLMTEFGVTLSGIDCRHALARLHKVSAVSDGHADAR